ncbi:hypothetical protein [Amycolatopsis sp.]|nr:hypothetical protein [Amycolatopsis sp.]HVV12084.1 hypothetical protein [Amycolatopsis sp.]
MAASAFCIEERSSGTALRYRGSSLVLGSYRLARRKIDAEDIEVAEG